VADLSRLIAAKYIREQLAFLPQILALHLDDGWELHPSATNKKKIIMAPKSNTRTVKNVVFVYGSGADASSWTKLILPLDARGLHAVAVQNPSSLITDDVASTNHILNFQNEPVQVVVKKPNGESQSYSNVSALMYQLI
jgi:hypothetical protein